MTTEKLTRHSSNCQPDWFKSFFRGLLRLAFGGCDVRGLENVPREGPLIVASTHRSYIDVFILGAFLPRVLHFMAKRELFKNRFFAALISAFGGFPIDRESARGSTFRTAIKLLRGGETIVIFPEGGIVNSHGTQGFKAGVGSLATMAKAPVLPVYLAGTNTLFNWPEILSDSPWMAIHVGKPVYPDDSRGREARDQIAERVEKTLLELEKNHLSSREVRTAAPDR